MQSFELPRVTRGPVAVRGHFHQPRARVVSRSNPFAIDWSRVFVASVVGVLLVVAVSL